MYHNNTFIVIFSSDEFWHFLEILLLILYIIYGAEYLRVIKICNYARLPITAVEDTAHIHKHVQMYQ